MGSIVAQIPTCLLDDEVNRALARLRTALVGTHPDYEQFQVAFDLRDEAALPVCHFIVIVDVP